MVENSLKYDAEYVTIIKNAIKRVTSQYAIVGNDPNFVDNCSVDELDNFLSIQSPETLQALPLKINPELFLETLLLEIRRVSINYSAMKKKKQSFRRTITS